LIPDGIHTNEADGFRPSPLFSVSVASKEVRAYVNALESTHTGISASVDSKWVTRRIVLLELVGLKWRSLELESSNEGGCRWKEKLQPGCRAPNAVIYKDKYATRR
jgi:hypothetical protein